MGKIYELRWYFKGDLGQYHSGDVTKLVGLFEKREDAINYKNRIEALTYDDGRQRFQCSISEIELNKVVDKLMIKELGLTQLPLEFMGNLLEEE